MKRKLILIIWTLCMFFFPVFSVNAKAPIQNISIPVGGIYYAGKTATNLSSSQKRIASPLGKKRIVVLKKGTATIKYKKDGQTKKIRLTATNPVGFRMNKVSGTYVGTLSLKIKAKTGYTVYYNDNTTPTKFYKIKSGQVKTLKLTKNTALRIQVFKNSKRKITTNFLLQNSKKAFRYYYDINYSNDSNYNNNVNYDSRSDYNNDVNYNTGASSDNVTNGDNDSTFDNDTNSDDDSDSDNVTNDDNDSDNDVNDKKDLNMLVAVLDQTEYAYDKDIHVPVVSIKDDDYTLIEGTDYTLTRPSSVTTGIYYILADGIGSYTGNIQLVYQIKNSLISWYEFLNNLGETLAENGFIYSNTGLKSSWTSALAASKKVCNCSAYICYALQIFEPTSKAGFKGQIYGDKTKPYGIHYKAGASLGTNIELIETNSKKPGELNSVLKEGDICMFWLVDKNVPHMAVYAGKDSAGNLLWYNGGKDAVIGNVEGGAYRSGGVGPSSGKKNLLIGSVLGILRIKNFAL